MSDFGGETFDPGQDKERLWRQFERVRSYVFDHRWHSLYEISMAVRAPVQSVSARLRDLRKKKFGGYTVDRRRLGDKSGQFEYRVEDQN